MKKLNSTTIKTHLIFTALITEKRRFHHKGTEKFANRNRVSIFLTTLETYRHLPVETADFYVELDETTIWAESTIVDSIKSLPFKVNFKDKRLGDYQDWLNSTKSAELNFAESLILISYDDHIFLKNSLNEFQRLNHHRLQIAKELKLKNLMVHLSHYPELHGLIRLAKATNTLLKVQNDYLVPVVIPLGTIIISPSDFINWFDLDFTQGKRFVAPENPFGPSVMLSNAHYLIPRTELFRHLDAYRHVRLNGWPYQVLDSVVKSNEFLSSYPRTPGYLRYQTTLEPPKNNFDTTILIDDLVVGSEQGFRVGILKSCAIRFSFESIQIVNSIYKLTARQIIVCCIKNLFQSRVFRMAIFRFLYELPFIGLFRLLLPIHSRVTVIKPKFFLLLIQASLTGYIRFFWIFSKHKLNRHIYGEKKV